MAATLSRIAGATWQSTLEVPGVLIIVVHDTTPNIMTYDNCSHYSPS